MKKALLAGLTNFLVLSCAFSSGALAQYHEYTSGKPSVEIDLGILDEATNMPSDYDTSTSSSAPLAPFVLGVPLAPEMPVATAPVPPSSPARKRLLKPSMPVAPAKPAATPVVPSVSEEARKLPEPEYTPRITEEPEQKTEEKPKKKIAVQELTKEESVAPPPSPPVAEKETAPQAAAVPSLGDLTLEFTGNSSDIGETLTGKLDNVAAQLAAQGSGRLQVRAYAAGEDGTTSSARRIALSRALAVRSYLMDKGIKASRVDVRALGSDTDRSPVDRVDLIFAQ